METRADARVDVVFD